MIIKYLYGTAFFPLFVICYLGYVYILYTSDKTRRMIVGEFRHCR